MIERWAHVLTGAAMLIVTCIGIVQAQQTALWGGTPPKALTVEIVAYDPLRDVAGKDSSLSVSVISGGKKLRNLQVGMATLKNGGPAIRPEDMVEPPALHAEPPWRIVNVVGEAIAGSTPLVWEKISDQEFQIKKTLINPGDYIGSRVYLTWDGPGPQPSNVNAQLRWTARIINGKLLPPPPYQYRQASLVISVWDWGILFAIFSYAVYHGLTLLLLAKSNIVSNLDARAILMICGFGAVNLVAAASSAAFVFGPALNGEHTLSPLTHLSVLLNFGLIIYLWYLAKTTKSAPTTSGKEKAAGCIEETPALS